MIYLLREYDMYFQDVRHTYFIEADTENTAIEKCKQALGKFCECDCIEIQLLVKGMSLGEWCMIGAAYYEDYEIVYDECFC